MLISLLNPKITSITKHAPLIAVETVASGHDVMDQAERVIDTNVHLHAKVPLIAFSDLVHFGRSDDSVTLAALVLGERLCGNDRRINNYLRAASARSSPNAFSLL
jgi:hypothetical protein